MTTAAGPGPVLCLGEALVDVVERDGRVTGEHVGGSPLNVACGLSRLGHPTTIGAWWGRDERGRRIEQHAAEHGLAVASGSDGAPRTSVAHAHLDAQGQASYEFELEWALPPLPGLDRVAHLHTGSIAATLEPGGSQVVEAIRTVRAHATTSYDPNVRPALMGSPREVLPRVLELVALADVVKASDEDVAWLYPDTPVQEVMRRWVQAGPALVVVTRGSQGAWAMLAGWPGVECLDPVAVQVADTVGAGDSFMGGLLSGLLDAGLLGSREAAGRLSAADFEAVRPALRRAAATSGLTVARRGAHAPTRDELAAALRA